MGVKPIIVDDKARELYDRAKEILREYVDDSFTVYEKLQAIYDYIVEKCKSWAKEENNSTGSDRIKVETGSFGADMSCHILNDGPFTIMLDSTEI